MTPLLAGIGPFGTAEILVIAALVGIPALIVGGVIVLVLHFTRKKN
jgi:hypothetical protein